MKVNSPTTGKEFCDLSNTEPGWCVQYGGQYWIVTENGNIVNLENGHCLCPEPDTVVKPVEAEISIGKSLLPGG